MRKKKRMMNAHFFFSCNEEGRLVKHLKWVAATCFFFSSFALFFVCLFVFCIANKKKAAKKNAFASGHSDVKKGASGVFFFSITVD